MEGQDPLKYRIPIISLLSAIKFHWNIPILYEYTLMKKVCTLPLISYHQNHSPQEIKNTVSMGTSTTTLRKSSRYDSIFLRKHFNEINSFLMLISYSLEKFNIINRSGSKKKSRHKEYYPRDVLLRYVVLMDWCSCTQFTYSVVLLFQNFSLVPTYYKFILLHRIEVSSMEFVPPVVTKDGNILNFASSVHSPGSEIIAVSWCINYLSCEISYKKLTLKPNNTKNGIQRIIC